MKYKNEKDFEKVNKFGLGIANEMFAKYFIGKSYLNFYAKPGDWPVFLANVTFEPGCRNNWHIHHATEKGGQILICTAGEGWYQQEGKKVQSLSEGSFVYIPSGVKHWHGAKKDSWFSHISVELPGTDCKNEWLEPVSNSYYSSLKAKEPKKTYLPMGLKSKYTTKKEFDSVNMFKTGIYNFFLAKYFIGKSYLTMLTRVGKVPLFFANVTFEPGCRNNWHIHHATKNGGQILVCTAGKGWYQEAGKEAVSLEEGSVVYIPSNVKHWHGAKKDSWFSHIAIEISGDNSKNEWCEKVNDEQYNKLS
ncbi:MAG: cupin domain-containing protein [Pleomorphochaeta sp.]